MYKTKQTKNRILPLNKIAFEFLHLGLKCIFSGFIKAKKEEHNN